MKNMVLQYKLNTDPESRGIQLCGKRVIALFELPLLRYTNV